eukprot:3591063-Rhodomonas_salina.1
MNRRDPSPTDTMWPFGKGHNGTTSPDVIRPLPQQSHGSSLNIPKHIGHYSAVQTRTLVANFTLFSGTSHHLGSTAREPPQRRAFHS